MDTASLLKLIPEPYLSWIAILLVLSSCAIQLSTYIGRAFHAITMGGGIKGIFSAIWLGTNTPKDSHTTTDISTTKEVVVVTTKDEPKK